MGALHFFPSPPTWSPISRSLHIWAASFSGSGASVALLKGFLRLAVRQLPGSVYGEKSLGGLCWVGPAVAAHARSSLANQSLLYNHAGRDVQGPVGGVHVWGGGFLFKRQGGWNGGSQLAVGSISTDKALPCRCEEFQLNMQPICLCVGEGLLEGGGWRQRLCGIPANQKLAPFITGTRGFPQPSCALAGVARRRQTEEARERLGRRVPGWKGFRNF